MNIKELPKIIKTERLELRQLESTLENAQLIFDAVKNENPDDFYFEYIVQTNDIIPQSVSEVLKQMKTEEEWNADNGATFHIFHNNDLVGYRRVYFFDSPSANKTFRFAAVWFIKSARNKGFAKESMARLEEIAFNQLGANRTSRICAPENIVSANLAKSMGYHLDGISRQNVVLINGAVIDSMMWSKLKSEYK